MSNDVEIRVSSKNEAGKGFKDAERDASKLGKSLEQIGAKAGQGLGKVGGKLTEGLSGAFKAGPLAAIGVGASIGGVLVGGISQALDQGDIQATMAAQLGLAGADADKYGKAAADLYKAGYGDSIQGTADITKSAFEAGLVSAKSSKQAIMEVGQQVAVYNKLTGEDSVAATRAAAQMIKTGLAKNATEAFDILTRGQQLGINKSQDLLDTFNEYGVQFQKLGLNAKDSLGLMNQMIRGGARDSDTAADAIKEFSIRAVDGSKSSADGFRSLGLDVKATTKAFGEGGPAAKKSFDTVLDRLRAMKDPVEQNRVGVELFGTKWEDLGKSIMKADLTTAAGSLGQVAGATQDVNDALSATPKAKIETLKRTLQQTFVDLFVKYALPTVTKFVDYLSGPGIYEITAWALGGTQAVIGFADKFLGGLDVMLKTTQDWGKWTLRAMAATFAVFNPALAKSMLDASNSVDKWAGASRKSIQNARDKLASWNSDVARMKTEVRLKADKADLDQKLTKAKAQLKDPALTATKRAQLTATITSLQKQVNAAQAKIDSLHGKTVTITANIYRNMIETVIPGGIGVKLPRASGGPVQGYAAGGTPTAQDFLVGENGPEILSMSGGSVGHVTPAGDTRRRMEQGGAARVVLEFRGDGSRYMDFLIQEFRKYIRVQGGNVQVVLGS